MHIMVEKRNSEVYRACFIFQLNIKLIELLMDAGGTVTSHKSDTGKTILHHMADLCMQSDLSRVLRVLVEQVR